VIRLAIGICKDFDELDPSALHDHRCIHRPAKDDGRGPAGMDAKANCDVLHERFRASIVKHRNDFEKNAAGTEIR
jgi:hypothetical protein